VYKYQSGTKSLYNLCISSKPINIMNTVSITVPHRGIPWGLGWALAAGRLTPPLRAIGGGGTDAAPDKHRPQPIESRQ